MKTTIVALTLTLLTATHVQAFEPERAIVNLASDYAQCTAFFLLASEGEKSIEQFETAEKYQLFAGSALETAIALSNEDTANARIKLALQEQTERMKYNFSNFAVLIVDYADMCHDAMTQPKKRLQYWLEKN